MLIHMSEIVIKNVSKSYDEGESYSVKNLSLSIKKGTIFGGKNEVGVSIEELVKREAKL